MTTSSIRKESKMKTRYKVINDEYGNKGMYGRIGTYQFEHDDGLVILKFRKKKPPYPTPKDYTCGFYPKEIKELK